MWNEQKRFLELQLAAGERLLWTGQPRQGVLLRAADAYLIPFSLLWGGFAIFWEVGALSTDAPFFFKLWGVPFVLAGLYIMVGRFFADARQRDKTYYGVTNERVIIVSGILSRKVKSLNLRTLTDVSLDEKSDGSGTITFGAANPMSWWSGGVSFPGWGQSSTPGFELIREAKKVYEIIRNAQRQSAQGEA
jgi:Bacterial PH domain